MAFFSRLSPVPAFPPYSGPYSVGSCDCELPVHELDSPSEAPGPDLLGTVAFRIFYPCTPSSSQRPVRWVPTPQRGYISAYAKFLGANNAVSEAFSLIPQLLHYTSIPVHRNAQLLEPDNGTQRWPVVVFSHGLGGSRNAYSYIVGSLASYGLVVIAPDHRDGSAPISYVRATDKTPARIVTYKKYPHSPTQEVYDARDEQLRIRLWELGVIHDALLRIDGGNCPQNLDPNSSYRWKKNATEVLKMFAGRLNIHEPNSVIWAGHSFGAATVVQLVKSTYYRVDPEKAAMAKYKPVFAPSSSSKLAQQITSKSTVILLDMWALPLRSPNTRWLWKKPMPCYAPDGPGGIAILAILSEAFYKWTGNMNDTKRALAPPGNQRGVRRSNTPARMFYPATSAHLSQSDFGILFPFLVKRFLKVEDPERILRLNIRAILQTLRENGHRVANTTKVDLEEVKENSKPAESTEVVGMVQDLKIFDRKGGVHGWIAVDHNVEGDGATVEEHSKTPADEVDETEVLGEVRV